MSYEFREYLKDMRQGNNEQYVKDEYNKLDKTKKEEIMQRVQSEIDQLKAKYLVDQRKSQQRDDDVAKRQNYLQTSGTNVPSQNDYMFRLSPHDMLLQSQQSDALMCHCEEEVLKDVSMEADEMDGNMGNIGNIGEKDRELINRAKNNLNRLRNDLDELDQYDVSRGVPPHRRSVKERDEYGFEEEEMPKNLETEMSQSRKSGKSNRSNRFGRYGGEEDNDHVEQVARINKNNEYINQFITSPRESSSSPQDRRIGDHYFKK
jgi:hypothetical protein